MKTAALIGMTGCGKTAVGKRLAALAGMEFADLDEAIVAAAGMPVVDIFRAGGEEAFREAERRALSGLLERETPFILSCGGGAILREENRALLREKALTIWLRRDPELVLRDRAVLRRPPICGQKSNYLALLEKRTPVYEAAADLVFDCPEGADLAAKELFALLFPEI